MTKLRKTSKKSVNKDLPHGAREKILEVAIRLFAEKGLKATSTRDIARESQLNISLISYYFGGKLGLYRTILYEYAREVREKMDRIAHEFSQKEMSPQRFKEELSSMIRNFVETRLAAKDFAKIMMAEKSQGMPYAKEVFESLLIPSAERFIGMVDEGQKLGFLRATLNPRAFFIVMTESIFGYFQALECKIKFSKEAYQLPQDKEEFIKFLTELLTEGIII